MKIQKHKHNLHRVEMMKSDATLKTGVMFPRFPIHGYQMKRLSVRERDNFIPIVLYYSARCCKRIRIALLLVGVLDKRKRLVSIDVIRVRFSSPSSLTEQSG